ncbi:MAG: GNAT family N-acetyltransferase [Pelagimonas sp.]|jgi:putative acetyltransferase|nr:GNAT family N-acetyltransferase [Pelagimonas sp.]
MDITTDYKEKTAAITALFLETFTASEGAEAGAVIRDLVAEMLSSVNAKDMYVFSALQEGEMLASILFTRMTYPDDTRTVFILSPVAVATGQQGKGIGQKLITYALGVLRQEGVDVALTYGDIRFYEKVGFALITEAEASPPVPLQYPEGWLGQALSGAQFTPLSGPSRCVAALSDPSHW